MLRVDNQQATNCDNYAYTRIIPLLLSEEEREQVKQKLDELQQAELNNLKISNIKRKLRNAKQLKRPSIRMSDQIRSSQLHGASTVEELASLIKTSTSELTVDLQ